jgi:transposase InsO family protein
MSKEKRAILSLSAILRRAAAKHHDHNGFYPKTILDARAYPMRENRAWCKERGIRRSDPRVGRKSAEEKASESRQIYQNECEHVEIEGSFGVCKSRCGLDRGVTRLPDTSMTSISMGVSL